MIKVIDKIVNIAGQFVVNASQVEGLDDIGPSPNDISISSVEDSDGDNVLISINGNIEANSVVNISGDIYDYEELDGVPATVLKQVGTFTEVIISITRLDEVDPYLSAILRHPNSYIVTFGRIPTADEAGITAIEVGDSGWLKPGELMSTSYASGGFPVIKIKQDNVIPLVNNFIGGYSKLSINGFNYFIFDSWETCDIFISIMAQRY
jgi:hypothetical protein